MSSKTQSGGAGDSVGGASTSGTTESSVCGGGPGIYSIASFIARSESIFYATAEIDCAGVGGGGVLVNNCLGGVISICEADATDVGIEIHGNFIGRNFGAGGSESGVVRDSVGGGISGSAAESAG